MLYGNDDNDLQYSFTTTMLSIKFSNLEILMRSYNNYAYFLCVP